MDYTLSSVASLGLPALLAVSLAAAPLYAPSVPLRSQRRYSVVLARFPARCQAPDVPVRWGPTRRGFYDPATGVTLPRKANAGLFAHEWGHVVMDRVFPTGGEYGQWQAFWTAHRGWMPNAYARTNAVEGWAECCRCWVTRKRLRSEVRAEVQRLCEGG